MEHTILQNITSFEECIAHLKVQLSDSTISEPRRVIPSLSDTDIDEHFLQCIWFDRHLKEDTLKTLSKKNIRIVQPGRWNTQGGPDFINAEIKLNDSLIKGDIEIHISSNDWRNHTHHKNPEYNNVILHAFLNPTDSETYDTNYYGNKIERLELTNYIFPDIQTLKKIISIEDYHYESVTSAGKCATVLKNQPAAFIQNFLDFAGDKRIEQKVARFENQLKGEGYNQVLYQAIMTAMGYKGSKPLFFLLSKRVPIDELFDYVKKYEHPIRIEIIESILLNVANLIPHRDEFNEYYDEETMEYINRLNKHWAEFSTYFSDRIIPLNRNWYVNVRPVNFPVRRIAGISHLIAKYTYSDFFTSFVKIFNENKHKNIDKKFFKWFIKILQGMLTIDEDDFWSYRFSFGTKKSLRRLKLIGENMADSIIFNSLFPLIILQARKSGDAQLEAFCMNICSRFPKLSENVITKFMSYRIFENDTNILDLINSEKRQQAFFHIFNECCGNNAISCENCVYSTNIP